MSGTGTIIEPVATRRRLERSVVFQAGCAISAAICAGTSTVRLGRALAMAARGGAGSKRRGRVPPPPARRTRRGRVVSPPARKRGQGGGDRRVGGHKKGPRPGGGEEREGNSGMLGAERGDAAAGPEAERVERPHHGRRPPPQSGAVDLRVVAGNSEIGGREIGAPLD